MTLAEFKELCLTFPDSVVDSPFSSYDTETARHLSNKKWFALLITLEGRPAVNLKCEPMKADFWRGAYPGAVVPAWHMNKEHWNTLYLDSGVPERDIFEMLSDSYELTRGKPRQASR